MTTCLGKSCSFHLLRVPFVNCCQFMYLVISLLVLRAGYGIWLYQFLFTVSFYFACLQNMYKYSHQRTHQHTRTVSACQRLRWWESYIILLNTVNVLNIRTPKNIVVNNMSECRLLFFVHCISTYWQATTSSNTFYLCVKFLTNIIWNIQDIQHSI